LSHDYSIIQYQRMQERLQQAPQNPIHDMSEMSGPATVEDLNADGIEFLLHYGDAPDYLRSLLPRIAMTESRGATPARYMAAKIQSLVDSIAPNNLSSTSVTYRCYR